MYRDRVGRIYSFDFNSPLADPQELAISAAEGFQLSSPHGISVWTDPNSGKSTTEDVILLILQVVCVVFHMTVDVPHVLHVDCRDTFMFL